MGAGMGGVFGRKGLFAALFFNGRGEGKGGVRVAGFRCFDAWSVGVGG